MKHNNQLLALCKAQRVREWRLERRLREEHEHTEAIYRMCDEKTDYYRSRIADLEKQLAELKARLNA